MARVSNENTKYRNSASRQSSSGTKRHSRRKRFNQTPLFKILRAALLIVIVLFIVNIISDLFKKSPKEISIVIDKDKIELKHQVLVDDSKNIYLSLDDIKAIYDPNIYYKDDTVITTYNKHIAVLVMNKTTMSVNDVVQEIKGKLKKDNGILYLPYSDMKNVYDFEYTYNENKKSLLIDTLSNSLSDAVVLKNLKVKEKAGGFFTKTVDKIKKTESVRVFSTEGEYSLIRTESGKVGYVKTKNLSTPEKKRDSMDEDKITSVKILDEYNTISSEYEVVSNIEGTTITMPSLFNIVETNGEFDVQELVQLNNQKFDAYKTWAEESNISICPIVTLGTSMNSLANSYVKRTSVINGLFNKMVMNGLHMICIDFTDIDDQEGFYRFLIEMEPRFKSAGMKVIVKYNGVLSLDRIESIVDYVIK